MEKPKAPLWAGSQSNLTLHIHSLVEQRYTKDGRAEMVFFSERQPEVRLATQRR
jgi:hypothetical protein